MRGVNLVFFVIEKNSHQLLLCWSCLSQVFTGGISNQLYGYYQDGKFDEDVVLVRVYGHGTELMIDRETEAQNIQVYLVSP